MGGSPHHTSLRPSPGGAHPVGGGASVNSWAGGEGGEWWRGSSASWRRDLFWGRRGASVSGAGL